MSHRAVLAVLLGILLARAACAAELHVDPLGHDAATGDAASPWLTIQHAIRQAQPGDTVWVHAGTYAESVRIDQSGTPEAPIAIRGLDGVLLAAPPDGISMEAIDVAAGVGHLVIEGLTVEGFAESIMLRPGVHDVVLRGCTVRHGDVAIWIAGASHVVVEGCTLEDNRLGLRVSGAASDVVVRDTSSVGNDDGLGCSGDADGFSVEETVNEVRFERCAALANGEDGFDLQGDFVSVAQSESRGNGCSGLKIGQHARVENTLVTANGTGIATTSFYGDPVRIELVNDTVADNHGVQLLLRGRATDPATPSTVLLRNLIVVGAGKLLEIEHPLELGEDHNLFFRRDTSSAAIVMHHGDDEHRYSGQAINAGTWAEESGQGDGTLAVDPDFVDMDRYAVAADSAAVDRGAADAPAVDRQGQARPAGAAVDIGVDEAPEASGNHTPWADPGPDREVAAGVRQRLLAAGSVDPDGDRLTYAWDFGDGSKPAAGYSVTHTWATAGDYRLALTVSDGTLSRTRAATVRVHEGAMSPTPTPTAAPSGHDSSVRVVPDRLRLRLTDARPDGARRLQVVVRNADLLPMPERPGHLIHVVAERGTCPAALRLGDPDFSPGRRGIQDAMVVGGGRQHRAAVWVSVDPDGLPSGGAAPLRCTMLVRAVGPDEDPTPADNVAAVEIVICDERGR